MTLTADIEKPLDQLFDAIAAREDDLVQLTRDLIRFPTVNPPGDYYRPCAEFLGERLRGRGFEVSYVRAEGAPGDSDALPRTNVIAPLAGLGGQGRACTSTVTSTSSTPAKAGPWTRSRGW